MTNPKPLGMLDGGARDLLMGVEPMTRAQLLHDRGALTADAVATAVRGVLEALIALVPTDLRRRPDDRLPEYAPERRDRPDGRVHRPTAQWRLWRERSELHVGEGFLSYRLTDPDDALTWRFEDVVAGIPGLSGSLTVVGRDGYSVVIHPHRYQDGLRARDDVAAALGPSRTVPSSDREQALAPSSRASCRPPASSAWGRRSTRCPMSSLSKRSRATSPRRRTGVGAGSLR